MLSLSRALGVGVLMLAAPLATPPAEAAAPPPYHLADAADHLTLAGDPGPDDDRWWNGRRWDDHRRDDHRRDDDWRDRHRRDSWSHERRWGDSHRPRHLWPQFRQLPWAGMHHFLPPAIVERRLRRQSFQPIGRIELRHGVYLVRAVDPFGRRVLLAVDPVTGGILGRQRRR
jgi:hypothetical protein